MSRLPVRRMIFEADPDVEPPEDMTTDERFLLDHLVTVATLVALDVPRHLELRRALETQGATDALREEARARAEELAIAGQSLARRRDLVVAARDTPVNPSQALVVLDTLFFSYASVIGDEDEEEDDDTLLDAFLDADELRALVSQPGLAEWFDALGAQAPVV